MPRLIILSLAIFLIANVTVSTHAQNTDDMPFAIRGPHPVGVVDLLVEDGEDSLDITMWYPALNPDDAEESVTYELQGLNTMGIALRDADPDIGDRPYPVIYYSHGLFGARLESTYYTEHLASWGFVVFAVDHKGSTFFNTTSSEDVIQSFGYRPQEMMHLIAYADELNDTDVYTGLMDMERQAVTGFSFGGYTSLLAAGAGMDTASLSDYCVDVSTDDNLLCEENYLQLLAETMNLDTVPEGLWPVFTDERIKALVPMAPCCVEYIGAEGLSGIRVPIMVIVGNRDYTAPADLNGIPAFEGTSSTAKALVLLDGAGHEVFPDAYANDSDRYHDLIKHFATAFFMWQLKDDVAAEMSLDPSVVNFDEVEYRSSAP